LLWWFRITCYLPDMSKYLFSLNKIRFVVTPIYYSQKSKATRILAFSENLFNLLNLGTLLCRKKKILQREHSQNPTPNHPHLLINARKCRWTLELFNGFSFKCNHQQQILCLPVAPARSSYLFCLPVVLTYCKWIFFAHLHIKPLVS
jgi:hypothetical protein